MLSDYEEVITQENPCQFSALSIHLGNKILVCFGGTDDSVVGWHEDFLLLYLEEIPSHTLGLKYLNKVTKKYDSNFIFKATLKKLQETLKLLSEDKTIVFVVNCTHISSFLLYY